jgi:hypothetical protein
MNERNGPFEPNREDVAAKVIDGELIVIRLSDGTYYSMDNVGARAWELIGARLDLPAVSQALAAWYGVPVDRVECDLIPLVDQLLSEGLLVAVEPDSAASVPSGPTGELPEYEPPQLHIHRDMGNLLALDPPTPGIDDLLFRGRQAG